MKLSWKKVQIYMARRKISSTDFGRSNIYRIRKGHEMTPRTAGIIAEALGCDVTEIMEEE